MPEANLLAVRREAIDMLSVVQDEIEQLRDRAADRGIRIDLHVGATDVQVRPDTVYLRQILAHLFIYLLGTCRTGRIDVQVDAESDRTTIRVAEADALAAEPIAAYRVENGHSLRRPTPPGEAVPHLTTVRRLTERMCGHFRIERKRGHGRTFSVDLPTVGDRPLRRPARRTPQRAPRRWGRLLVVEDDPTLTGFMVLLLANWYEVATAPDISSALDTARRSRPDAVLLAASDETSSAFERLREIPKWPGYESVQVLPLARFASMERLHG